ncbi:MAG: undecaprenyl-diphosphate phosphatase [Anaerolineae bacterium]
MDILNAILLGIVEGVTEFLPISSTGHLIIVEEFIKLPPTVKVPFDVIIQLGAILAVVWLFRHKIIDLFRRLPSDRGAQRFGLAIVIAFIPAAILGFLLRNVIQSRLFNPITVSLALIVGGIIMWVLDNGAERAGTQKDVQATTPLQALGIGIAQSVSLWPGFSRSASSIIGGLLVGLDRQAAVEFSFWLAIPTMFAATLYEGFKSARGLSGYDWLLIAIGFVTAFITAFIVVRWFLHWVSNHTLRPFAVYRIILGGLVLCLFFLGIIGS